MFIPLMPVPHQFLKDPLANTFTLQALNNGFLGTQAFRVHKKARGSGRGMETDRDDESELHGGFMGRVMIRNF